MKNTREIPSFDSLRDSEWEGMFFKDEGDFLTVKFEKDTKKPAGDGLYPFGSLIRIHITKADLFQMKRKSDLLDFFKEQLK